MDTLTFIATILGGGAASMLIVQVAKEGLAWVDTRYGSLVTQLVLLVASFLVAGGAIAVQLLPANILQMAALIFGSAMAIYEVLWKALIKQAVMGKTDPKPKTVSHH